jgi:hypothetical protein
VAGVRVADLLLLQPAPQRVRAGEGLSELALDELRKGRRTVSAIVDQTLCATLVPLT